MNRRRLSFSLRTLFVVLTLAAIWLGWNANIVVHRRKLLDWAREQAGAVSTRDACQQKLDSLRSVGAAEGSFAEFEHVPDVPWTRRLMGDESIALIEFYPPAYGDGEDLLMALDDDRARPMKYFPMPPEQKAELRRFFPETLIDYGAGR